MPDTDDDYRNLGLSREELRQRIANGAVNRVDSFTTRSSAAILRNNVLTLFTVVLALAVAALLVVGAYKDAVFLAGVTVANSLAGMISELRAKRALDHLAILALGASLNILAIYWAPISDCLGLVAIDADSWLTILIAAALGSTAMHLRLKDGLRRRARVRGETE
ncbi:hypothetical protein [Acidithiobacillus sp.]